jgi:antitoxin (DNA-binding transcriptional repressor) of toxin-antitoxin stability system
MRNVGIKELKNQASAIVQAGEPVIIERYGRPVGLYVPLEGTPGENSRAYALAGQLQRLMTEIAAPHGLTPDALADEIEQLAGEEQGTSG